MASFERTVKFLLGKLMLLRWKLDLDFQKEKKKA